MADLENLLARVKASSGYGEGGLDVEVWDALYFWPKGGPYTSWRAAARAFGWNTDLTRSVDAGLILAPLAIGPGLLDLTGGWEPGSPDVWPAWSVRWYPQGAATDGKSWHAAVETAKTPALALMAAVVSTKIRLSEQPLPQREGDHA